MFMCIASLEISKEHAFFMLGELKIQFQSDFGQVLTRHSRQRSKPIRCTSDWGQRKKQKAIPIGEKRFQLEKRMNFTISSTEEKRKKVCHTFYKFL